MPEEKGVGPLQASLLTYRLHALLYQLLEQRPVTPAFTDALAAAEQRDCLAGGNALGQRFDQRFRRMHLAEISCAVGRPIRPGGSFAVGGGVEGFAGAEIGMPLGPGFAGFRQASRAVTADQDTRAVVRLSGIIPAFGADFRQAKS